MNYQIKEEGGFKYIETSPGKPVLLLLHGLFGALSNFEGIIDRFSPTHNVVIPMLPIYELPLLNAGLSGLVDHVKRFVEMKDYHNINVMGNSLGGHIAILYALQSQDRLDSITLTGSSGLFENSLGSTFPKRGNYEFIKNKTGETFYDPATATTELVDEVFDIVNDRNKVIRVIATAKSAVRHNLADKLHNIKIPTLLIWGKQDTITPPFVAEQFKELIKGSQLHFIDLCGHAPMMEKPKEFNDLLANFLNV
ncbi:MAG: alpha/beta hydrolase [Saprospiraceae bacterium]